MDLREQSPDSLPEDEPAGQGDTNTDRLAGTEGMLRAAAIRMRKAAARRDCPAQAHHRRAGAGAISWSA